MRRTGDAIAGLALLLCIVAGRGVASVQKKRLAREQMRELSTELRDREKLIGRPADSLSELGYRLFPIFEDGRPTDPWGNAYRYRVRGPGGSGFELSSTGPDGVPSEDDVALPKDD